MAATPEMETVWLYANRLLTCVHQALAFTEAGAPARYCVVPGGQVAWDDCECDGGQLTVHVATDYPADTFPLQKLTGPFDKCDARWLVVELVVTVLRCVHTSDDRGKAPTCTQLAADGHQAFQDRWAVRRGAACCFADDNRLSRPPVLLQEAVSVGGEGQCAGVELHALVGFTNCLDCSVELGAVVDGNGPGSLPGDIINGGSPGALPADVYDGGAP